MEDAHVIYESVLSFEGKDVKYSLNGILDGHGGIGTANKKLELVSFIEEELRSNFRKKRGVIDEEIVYNSFKIAFVKFQKNEKDNGREKTLMESFTRHSLGDADSSGATVLFVFKSSGKTFFINLGDSKAILVDRKTGKTLAFTKEHKPESEEKGVNKRGGFVKNGRIGSILATGRAIGNPFLVGMNFRPTVTRLTEDSLEGFPERGDLDIIIACDGLWDFCTPELLGKYYAELHRAETTNREVGVMKKVVKAILKNGSTDNVTAMKLQLGI
jgi:serine/threonine protein phosphatase PrpC